MRYILSNILLLICLHSFSQVPMHPFPQHVKYFDGVIIPNHISQQELDDSTASFYRQWKARYIRRTACTGSYYVWAENAGKNHECVSEGQGYGMMIIALMAQKEEDRVLFNDMLQYRKEHPSKRNPLLMSWAQGTDWNKFEESSASDGDIDIAYSLLLADAQWGSSGKVNYLLEAKQMIRAIWEQEINSKTFNVLQSNSIESDSRDYFDMRSSDFIPSAFRAFSFADSNNHWSKVIDENYRLFDFMQKTYSPDAGLVPDFIQHVNTKSVPARSYYLESKYDGLYNYNACRVPWRIATDYIVSGEQQAKQFVAPINKWIRETTDNNPDNISAGYTLAGDDLRRRNFEALSFISSFSIAAMVDAKNQIWLNSLWDYITRFKMKDFDYYDNSIKMINLIILSGNYWIPKIP